MRVMHSALILLFISSLSRNTNFGLIAFGVTVSVAVVLSAVLSQTTKTTVPRVLTILLGLFVPLASGLDRMLLLCMADFYFFVVLFFSYRRHITIQRTFFHPFILFLLASCLATFTVEVCFEYAVFSTLLTGPLGHIREYLWASPIHALQILDLMHLFVLVLLTFQLYEQERVLRSLFIRGIGLGLFFSAIIAVVQSFAGFTSFFPNHNPFWNLEGRVPGLFSDPNAFGIFTCLLLPIILCEVWQYWRSYPVVLLYGATILGSSLLSGSRTLILGLILYAFFFVGIRQQTKKARWRALVTFTFLLVVSVSFLLVLSSFNSSLLPSSLQRAVLTMTHPEWIGAFSGKLTLLRMAFAMWVDFPLLGVGVGGFRNELLAYLATASSSLGGWEDNANNFYIELLAECGLWGMCLFVCSLLCFASNDEKDLQSRWARISLMVLMVLLLLGPHLSFPEVSMGTGLLIACGFTHTRWFPNRLALTFVGCLTFLLTLTASFLSDQGFYKWENASPKNFFRWTKGNAQAWFICPASGKHSLNFNVMQAKQEYTYTLVAFSQAQRKEQFIVPGPGAHSLAFDCTPHKKGLIRITVPFLWIPQQTIPGSSDPRPLGIMITAPQPQRLRTGQNPLYQPS